MVHRIRNLLKKIGKIAMYDIVDVVRGRKTTPNSTELWPNSTTLPSRIIRPKFG